MQIIDFKHDYYKLDDVEFSTIRGVSWNKKIQVGDKVSISKRGKFLFVVEVTFKIVSPIKNILTHALRYDGSYPGCELRDGHEYEDFIDLLNSFYPRNVYEHAKATMESKVCFFRLGRI